MDLSGERLKRGAQGRPLPPAQRILRKAIKLKIPTGEVGGTSHRWDVQKTRSAPSAHCLPEQQRDLRSCVRQGYFPASSAISILCTSTVGLSSCVWEGVSSAFNFKRILFCNKNLAESVESGEPRLETQKFKSLDETVDISLFQEPKNLTASWENAPSLLSLNKYDTLH